LSSLGTRKKPKVTIDSCDLIDIEITKPTKNSAISGENFDVIRGSSPIGSTFVLKTDSELFCCDEMSELAKYLTAKGSRVDDKIRSLFLTRF
jgi:hypothetical protein